MTLASKQACIFQNEDTDPEHELHEKARRSTARPAASDTERRCSTPKEGPGEKWADNAQGLVLVNTITIKTTFWKLSS